MAIVTRLERDTRSIRGAHPTKLTARYQVDEFDGKRLLQINTYGSDKRQIEDKQSQTLQFTEDSAKELFEILKSEFNF